MCVHSLGRLEFHGAAFYHSRNINIERKGGQTADGGEFGLPLLLSLYVVVERRCVTVDLNIHARILF